MTPNRFIFLSPGNWGSNVRAKLISFEVRGSWINLKVFEWSFRDPVVTFLSTITFSKDKNSPPRRSSHLQNASPSTIYVWCTAKQCKNATSVFWQICLLAQWCRYWQSKDWLQSVVEAQLWRFFSQKLFACWLNLACCPLPNQSSQFTSLQWRATSRKQELEINSRNQQPKHIFHIFYLICCTVIKTWEQN